MSISNLDAFQLDRKAFRIRSLADDTTEVEYWLTQRPERRIQAIEFLRETFHGHGYPAQGLERVLTITRRA
jgi:hypothetical protein